ncbi:MAG: CapA family protein [Bryobacteraceae bacterium]
MTGRQTPNPDDTIVVTLAGDMMFDGRLSPPRLLLRQMELLSCTAAYRDSVPIPFLNNDNSRRWLAKQGCTLTGVEHTSHVTNSISLVGAGDALDAYAPFRHVGATLQSSDIVFANLECTLSSRGRRMKSDNCYRASPHFAQAMHDAGISIVSFSNNHCMDYGECAFRDTIQELEANDVAVVGPVINSDSSRRAIVIERCGISLAFLAYNLVGPDYVYAWDHESGVIPLNEVSLIEDLEEIRSVVDWVAVSVHWGMEGSHLPFQRQILLAHTLVDLGADFIIGHHTHVPGPIEIYKDKLIFYSLGNFLFGYTHRNWADNMIVTLRISRDTSAAEVVPLGTTASEQYQPAVLHGHRRESLLNLIRGLSLPYMTDISPVTGLVLPSEIR